MDPFASDVAFNDPTGPPPPYESVVDGGAGTASGDAAQYAPSSSAAAPAANDFDILVSDPVKQGEGVSAYVSYKVRSSCKLPQYASRSNEVIRRFRDFAWLSDRLAAQHRGVIIPALPEKSAVQKFQMSADFIEERRRGLQSFLCRVAAHPALRTSRDLQLFLEASESDFANEVARAQVAEGGATKKRLEGAVGWFKGLGAATQSLVSGRGEEAASEDPEYLKVRDYLAHLEAHLGEAARQAGRLILKEAELGQALAEFGQAVEKLGRLEEGNVQEAMVQLANKAASLTAASRTRTGELTARFDTPLKEAVRTVRSVQAVCADRGAALSAVTTARLDLDAKKVRWAKLRGAPGSGSDKLGEAERDVLGAEARLRSAKAAYDDIVTAMTEELNRFQKERSAEMNAMLREFALVQAALAADGAKAWGALLAELQAIQGAA